MGDLRNKMKRILDDERIRRQLKEQQACDRAREKASPLLRCLCGHTWREAQMVAYQRDRRDPTEHFCQSCAPDDVLALMWPDPEIDCMCNDYEREKAAAVAIDYMEEMKHTPPFEWVGGRIPNDADQPQPHIKIHDKGFTLRLADGKLQGDMTRWAWDQGKRPVYNFKSEGRDFSNSTRCLIMATAFYEYTDPAPAKPKVKLKDQHRFWMRGMDFFWIAGIIKEGCFAMLTTEPGADVKPFHSRQIVTLPLNRGMSWLTLDRPHAELLAPPPKNTLVHRLIRKGGIELLP